MKNTLPHKANYDKIFDKKIEKSKMTFVNLETTLEYLKIQESLRSRNFT